LDILKETRGYWELKEEALGSTQWRTGCGRHCGSVVRQTKGMDEIVLIKRNIIGLYGQSF
jgi:hypothetical protein